MSDEQREAISRGRKGMKFTDEHRANIARSRTGTTLTDETKAKLSEIRQRECNKPDWRKKMSEQTATGWKNPVVRASMQEGQRAHFATTENGNNFSTSIPQSELDYATVLCPAGFVTGHIIPTNRPENNNGGYYKLDYAHLEAKVDIEIDGSSHRFKKETDERRDMFLHGLGWKVIRIKV